MATTLPTWRRPERQAIALVLVSMILLVAALRLALRGQQLRRRQTEAGPGSPPASTPSSSE